MSDAKRRTAGKLARHRARYTTGLVQHAAAFVIIGSFPGLLEALGPKDSDWSETMIIAWGFGFALHALTWLIDRLNLRARLAS